MCHMTKPVALLINPPVYDFALFDLFHKPLGLLKIGRWLSDAGYRVNFVDGLDYTDEASSRTLGKPRRRRNGTGKFHRQSASFPSSHVGIQRRFSRYGMLSDSLEERISQIRPHIVLITSGMTYWYPGVAEAVQASRKVWPNAPVIVGGTYATLLREHCARIVGPDFVVAGEPFTALAGILEKKGLPVPAAAGCDLVLPEKRVWRGSGVIRLNEGCPMNCDYCASRLLSRRFQPGSVGTAVENLEALVGQCGIVSCAFYDDALLHDKERAFIPLLEQIIARRFGISFYLPNAVHLRYLDLYTAQLMKAAGFREIRLGYESSSPDFHERLDSKVVEQELEGGVALLREAGFGRNEIITYVLAGLPRQHADEVEASIRHASSLGVRVSLAEYSPVPGTALWDASVAAASYPIAEEPLYQNNSILSMEWRGFSRGDLQRLRELTIALSL